MTNDFIDRQKALYKTLQPCYCPALQETVHFNSSGLNHLLYLKRRPRSHSERHYRAALIVHLTEVISNATQATKEIKPDAPLVVIWILEHKCTDSKGGRHDVKVILKQEKGGRLYFLSAMKKK